MVTKNHMNTTVENRRFRTRSPFGWGVVALIAILAILVVGGLAFGAARAASAPAAVGYPYYGFFPFGFFFFPVFRRFPLPFGGGGGGRALPLVWALPGRASGDTEGEVRARRNHERTVRADDARPRAAQQVGRPFPAPL